MSKVCNECSQELPVAMFSKCSANADGLQGKCKPCDNALQRKRREDPEINERHKLRMRIRAYIRKYNLSEEEALVLVTNRNGECEICGETAPLVVDHCHDSNNVRGRLCSPCNTGLGLFKENINSLNQAIEYLRSYS
jgi:hypothetical protein